MKQEFCPHLITPLQTTVLAKGHSCDSNQDLESHRVRTRLTCNKNHVLGCVQAVFTTLKTVGLCGLEYIQKAFRDLDDDYTTKFHVLRKCMGLKDNWHRMALSVLAKSHLLQTEWLQADFSLWSMVARRPCSGSV